MAEREVTAADMEAAGERIAERDGVTLEDVRERVRQVDRAEAAYPTPSSGVRTCGLTGCDETFVPTNARHAYCKPAHRAAAHRAARTGGTS